MDTKAGEVLGWVYVAVKILGVVALVVLAAYEAWRFRKKMLERKMSEEDEDAGPPATGQSG